MTEEVGVEFLGEEAVFLVADEVYLWCGLDVVDLAPVDVGLAAAEVDPAGVGHVVVGEETLPFGLCVLVGLGEDGEGGDVEGVGHLVEGAVDGWDHLAAVAAGGAPEEEEGVFACGGANGRGGGCRRG